jgi:hypothetical protein
MCHTNVHQFTKLKVFENHVPKKMFELKADKEVVNVG